MESNAFFALLQDYKNVEQDKIVLIWVWMMKARQLCRALLLFFLFWIENTDFQGFRIANSKEMGMLLLIMDKAYGSPTATNVVLYIHFIWFKEETPRMAWIARYWRPIVAAGPLANCTSIAESKARSGQSNKLSTRANHLVAITIPDPLT